MIYLTSITFKYLILTHLGVNVCTDLFNPISTAFYAVMLLFALVIRQVMSKTVHKKLLVESAKCPKSVILYLQSIFIVIKDLIKKDKFWLSYLVICLINFIVRYLMSRYLDINLFIDVYNAVIFEVFAVLITLGLAEQTIPLRFPGQLGLMINTLNGEISQNTAQVSQAGITYPLEGNSRKITRSLTTDTPCPCLGNTHTLSKAQEILNHARYVEDTVIKCRANGLLDQAGYVKVIRILPKFSTDEHHENYLGNLSILYENGEITRAAYKELKAPSMRMVFLIKHNGHPF